MMSQVRDWSAAGDWCQQRCMDLVSIETQEEWTEVRSKYCLPIGQSFYKLSSDWSIVPNTVLLLVNHSVFSLVR